MKFRGGTSFLGIGKREVKIIMYKRYNSVKCMFHDVTAFRRRFYEAQCTVIAEHSLLIHRVWSGHCNVCEPLTSFNCLCAVLNSPPDET